MLARNPKTGAPIRILRSDASVSRNQKHMVWLQGQDPSIAWNRWDTLCIGISHIQEWKSKGKHIDYILLPEANQETVDFFTKVNSVDYKMMFITKSLVFEIGVQKFRALQITNVIVMEEAHLMYPFIGSEWDKSNEDAVVMISAILRMSKIQGLPSDYTSERFNELEDEGITIQTTEDKPMPLWYITQFYKPEKAKRAREIKKCLEENVKCSIIDKIVLLNEKDFSEELPKSDKIQQDIVGNRLTYGMVMEWITQHVPDNVVCVFGNADIYLDNDTWRDVWSIKLNDVFLALLRWDVQEGEQPAKIFGPRNDSQDTWAILSNSVKSKTWDYKALDFPFGKAGCDNAITVEMLRKKFLVVNPAMSLKTYHLQLSNVRNYDPKDVVDKPCYMYVDPTGIHDMEPVYEMKPFEYEKVSYSSFDRPLKGLKAKSVEVFCKMLERGERYNWKANSPNSYAAESVQLYRYTNAFQTPQGLVYGYDRIFVGKEEISKEMWSKSELSPIHPAYQSERSFAIPWKDEYTYSFERYVLEYLSKVLQLREKYGNGEFFASENEVGKNLEFFQWDEKQLPVLSHKPNVQVWCKELIQYPPQAKQEFHQEDIAALRKYLRGGWQQDVTANKWVVVIDGKYITMDIVRKWESENTDIEWAVIFEGRTSVERVFEKLQGAKGLICFGGPKSVARWGLGWVLPKGANIIELQNEMEPDGEVAHFAGASGLHHMLVIFPRASDKATQDILYKDVTMALKNVETASIQKPSKPIIYVPRKSLTGFYSHAGDSFREMLQLWEEKGYVELVEDSKAVQIWLGGVGKTLLYDRPTLDWLFTAPADEQTYELGLFGNPKPYEASGPAKSWFFWPRKPRFVEECVEKGLPSRNWSERSKFLVFYGKIENKVQEKRRKTYDWSKVCDDFVLVNGEGTPYKFSPMEYLENLSQAKFGLCLAGFGKKCHREVECMAMGCVPVVMTDVDMDNYAEPPQEGVHYIRIESPEDIEAKIKTVSEKQWDFMSKSCKQWWKENASVEGSWKLTQKLNEKP